MRAYCVAIYLSSLLLLPTATATQGKDAYSTTRWQPVDLQFSANPENRSGLDIEFSAKFSSPSGTNLSVPGFWDGENQFVIRFAPPSVGSWTYTTTSTLPALNNLEGTLTVTPELPGKRGPVGLDPNDSRRFRYADGTRYFPLAFEIDWLFALDAENETGIPKTKELVDYVARHGFNQVVMNVFAYDVRWPKDPNLPSKYDYGKPQVFPYEGNNDSPDFSTLNIKYFQRFDRVIRELERQGLIAHVMIYVWNKLVSWPEAESAADNQYFDYVVKRYQAFPNLIWDISKEATGYGHNDMGYISQRIDRLRALDGHNRLITVHDYGYCHRFPNTVDFISVQNWQSETWHIMRKIRQDHPNKAIFNIEHGGYESGPYHVFAGNYYRPEVNLERAYHIVFAGAYPTHYWQDAAWSVVIHDIGSLPSKDQPKFEYYRYLAEFVAKHDLTRLEPTTGRANSGFCLTNNKDLFVYLVPKENDIIIPRPPREGFNRIQLTWFDPFTGDYQEEAPIKMEQWNRIRVPNPGTMRIMIMRMQE